MKHKHSLGRISVSVLTSTLFALSLNACAKTDLSDVKNAADNVAIVDGKPISKAMFDAYVDAVTRGQGQQLNDAQRQQVLDQLINMQIAADTAEKQGAKNDSQLQAKLQLARLNVFMESTLKKYLDEHPVTDDEIKAEYDTYVAGVGREYHARHILVESKAVADSIIQQLKSGADFAKLAEKQSIDGSAKQGGDLGWFSLASMVKPFSDAVASLEKGKFTEEPVQTQYGWHVIKLEDFRSQTPRSFDDIKDQAKNVVQRKKAQAYIEELRKTAKFEKLAEKAETAEAKPAATPEK